MRGFIRALGIHDGGVGFVLAQDLLDFLDRGFRDGELQGWCFTRAESTKFLSGWGIPDVDDGVSLAEDGDFLVHDFLVASLDHLEGSLGFPSK